MVVGQRTEHRNLVPHQEPLRDRQVAELLKALRDCCYDPDSGGFLPDDLGAVLRRAMAVYQFQLTPHQWSQITGTVVSCLPGTRTADLLPEIAAWVAERKRSPHVESDGLLHALLTVAAEKATARADDAVIYSSGERFVRERRSDQKLAPSGLSSQYFLLAHDPRTGKQVVSEVVLGLGLAAAALCELRLADRIRIDPASGTVSALEPVVPDSAFAGLSFASREAYGQIQSTLGGEVEIWLQKLGASIIASVRSELLADQLIRRARSRFTTVYPQVTSHPFHQVASTVRGPLLHERAPEGRAGVLAEILHATGVDAGQRRELAELAQFSQGAGLTRLPRAGQYHRVITQLVRAVTEAAFRPL